MQVASTMRYSVCCKSLTNSSSIFTWSGTVRTHVDPKTWNVFWDYSIAGIPYAEVAEKYGVSKSAVFKYQKRVINRLKAMALNRINDERPLDHE